MNIGFVQRSESAGVCGSHHLQVIGTVNGKPPRYS